MKTRKMKTSCSAVYRAFLHDVTAAMLVFQNREMAAMMVYQTNPPGLAHFRYIKIQY